MFDFPVFTSNSLWLANNIPEAVEMYKSAFSQSRLLAYLCKNNYISALPFHIDIVEEVFKLDAVGHWTIFTVHHRRVIAQFLYIEILTLLQGLEKWNKRKRIEDEGCIINVFCCIPLSVGAKLQFWNIEIGLLENRRIKLLRDCFGEK